MRTDRWSVWARSAARRAAVIALVGLGLVSPAAALDDKVQLLSGGNQLGTGTFFTAPGIAGLFLADVPNTGLGESAAQAATPVSLSTNTRLAVSVTSDLVGANTTTFTYTLEFD